MAGKLGETVVSGYEARTSTTFTSGTEIQGSILSGFGGSQSSKLAALGCSDPNGAAQPGGYAGIDYATAERSIAHTCGVSLPRIEGSAYISLTSECGYDADTGALHEGMSCLYNEDASGHSIRIGEACDGRGIYGKWEDRDSGAGLYALPAVDACNGHFGPTPESSGVHTYHYHITDLAPYTVGCFGPAVDPNSGVETLVSPAVCEALYPGCDGDDVAQIATSDGAPVTYDRHCPCFGAGGTNMDQPPSPPPSAPSPPPMVPPAGSAVTLTITLNAGWTQISLNVNAASMTIASIFAPANVALGATALVKDKNAFTTYYPDYSSWYPANFVLRFDTMYLVKLTSAATLTVVGTPVDIASQQQTLDQGWNYLPCPYATSTEVGPCPGVRCNVPLATYAENDMIKSKVQFTTYYDGYGWYSAASFFLEPGVGYMLKKTTGGTETVGWAQPASGRRQLAPFDSHSAAVVGKVVDGKKLGSKRPGALDSGDGEAATATWLAGLGITPASYESSMALTVAVFGADGALLQAGTLLAYAGSSLRGAGRLVASAGPTPLGPWRGKQLFQLLAYVGAEDVNHALTFAYVAEGAEAVAGVGVNGTVAIASDAVAGNLLAPLELHLLRE